MKPPQNQRATDKVADRKRPAQVKTTDASQGNVARTSAADHETKAFQADLMEAVRDMKAGRAARVTRGTSSA